MSKTAQERDIRASLERGRIESGSGRRGALLLVRLVAGFLKQSPTALFSELIVLIMILIAIFAPALAPYDPNAPDMLAKLKPPNGAHWLGTDELGRDIFSRVLYGGRISMIVVVVVLSLVLALGIPIGAVAGYVGGMLDEVIMRFSDLIIAFPPLILAMALVVALGPSLTTAMIAVALVRWPRYARLVRAQVLTFKRRDFVEAARCIGASELRILSRHILINCLDPVIVRATVDSGYIILTTAALSFIGLGAQPPTPEWGNMVATGRTYIINYWWTSTFPGLAILIAVLGFTLVGDELRDRFDPTLRSTL